MATKTLHPHSSQPWAANLVWPEVKATASSTATLSTHWSLVLWGRAAGFNDLHFGSSYLESRAFAPHNYASSCSSTLKSTALPPETTTTTAATNCAALRSLHTARMTPTESCSTPLVFYHHVTVKRAKERWLRRLLVPCGSQLPIRLRSLGFRV